MLRNIPLCSWLPCTESHFSLIVNMYNQTESSFYVHVHILVQKVKNMITTKDFQNSSSIPFLFFFSFTFRFKNGDNFWPCSCGIGASITGKIKRGEGKPMQRNIVEPTMSHQSRHGSPTSSSSPRSSYQHHRRESDRYSSSSPSSMHSSSRRKSRSPDRYYYEDRGGGGSHHHRHHRYDEQHQQDVRCPPSSHWGGTFTYLQRAKEPV